MKIYLYSAEILGMSLQHRETESMEGDWKSVNYVFVFDYRSVLVCQSEADLLGSCMFSMWLPVGIYNN